MTSRFDSAVSVQLEGADRRYIPDAMHLMDVVMQRRTAGDLTMVKGYRRINDSTYAYAISAGGVNIVRVVSDDDERLPGIETLVTKYPDFVSGIVSNGVLEVVNDKDGRHEYCTRFRPTVECARLFKLRAVPQHIQKLAVLLYSGFEELQFHGGAPITYTQYVKLHPTMYSGTMVKCVQLLMGFGRQAKKSIYENKVSFADETPDGEVTDQPESVYQRELRDHGLRIKYDYRFMRTHGLTRASDGSWWLVEIGVNRGIVAMPLPLFDATTTLKFAHTLETMGDVNGQDAIELFGGYPSGESLPGFPEAFDAWVRAGRVIRLTAPDDVGGFYQHDFYSSAMGWAFNPSGSEAHNTAWRIEPSDGVQRGVHYKVDLRITTLAAVPEPPAAKRMRNDLAPMKRDEPGTFDANMFKLGRLTANQMREVQDAFNHSGRAAAYAVLNDIEAQPMASGSAIPRLAHQGNIFGPRLGAQIKFPEPLLGFLVSHDMRAERRVDHAVSCDTIMHVFFQGEQIKVCRYYSDPRGMPAVTREGYDQEWFDNNPVGDLAAVTTVGPIGIPRMFYTSDFDDRAMLGTEVTNERWKRRPVGYTTPTASTVGLDREGVHGVSDNATGIPDPPFEQPPGAVHPPNTVWRTKLFRFESWRETRNVLMLGASIVVPFNDRQAYCYGRMAGDEGGSDFYDLTWMRYGDPWVGEYGEVGGDRIGDQWQVLHAHYYTQSSPETSGYQRYQDAADDGNWVPVGADVRGVVASAPYTYPPERHTFTPIAASRTLTVYLVTAGYAGAIKTYVETRTGPDASVWESHWFLPSPDDFGFTDYMAEAHNGLGDSELVISDATINAPPATPKVIVGKPVYPELDPGVTFVGFV
jgi:hypothetical protein